LARWTDDMATLGATVGPFPTLRSPRRHSTIPATRFPLPPSPSSNSEPPQQTTTAITPVKVDTIFSRFSQRRSAILGPQNSCEPQHCPNYLDYSTHHDPVHQRCNTSRARRTKGSRRSSSHDSSKVSWHTRHQLSLVPQELADPLRP